MLFYFAYFGLYSLVAAVGYGLIVCAEHLYDPVQSNVLFVAGLAVIVFMVKNLIGTALDCAICLKSHQFEDKVRSFFSFKDPEPELAEVAVDLRKDKVTRKRKGNSK